MCRASHSAQRSVLSFQEQKRVKRGGGPSKDECECAGKCRRGEVGGEGLLCICMMYIYMSIYIHLCT